MLLINIPNVLKDKTCPQPTDQNAADTFASIKSMYPNADITEKKVKVALLLKAICSNNYEQAHWFVETTSVYEEHRGELSDCYYKWVEEAKGNPQLAVNKMVAELMMFSDYAQDIADTAF